MFLPKFTSSRFSTPKDRPLPKEEGVNGGQRILIVDDDVEICRLNLDFLSDVGYQTDVAESGVNAWKMIQRNRYDLIITDYNMPGLNGLDLVKRLRANKISTPVILTSGSAIAPEIIDGLDQTTVLPKPYTFDVLLDVVQSALEDISDISDSGPERLPENLRF